MSIRELKVRFVWKGGKTSEGKGVGHGEKEAVADAFTKLGYGAGAMAALEYHEVIREEKTPLSGEKSKVQKNGPKATTMATIPDSTTLS